MDRSWVVSLVLLILFVSNVSSLRKSRVLTDEEAPNDNSNSTTKHQSPPPNPKPIRDEKSNVTSTESPLPTSNSTNSNPKESDSVESPPKLQPGNVKNDTKVSNTTEPISSPPPPPVNQTDSGKLPAKAEPPPKSLDGGKNGTEPDKESPPLTKDSDKVSDNKKGSSESANAETCEGKSKICRTENSLVACTLSIDKGSANWLILVQNEGEKSLKANIIRPVNYIRELTLAKHHSQRVNISISVDTSKIVLATGKGECVLHMYPTEGNPLSIYLPSYEKLVTPVNGAYFLIVSVIIFGGTWASCLCQKKRRAGNEVPYRELELSRGPGSGESTVHDVETADWDEGWDDDWDENNAVKSPGSAAKGVSISANGLTAKAPVRDGWDHDWDD